MVLINRDVDAERTFLFLLALALCPAVGGAVDTVPVDVVEAFVEVFVLGAFAAP